jgi:hypothetical protein
MILSIVKLPVLIIVEEEEEKEEEIFTFILLEPSFDFRLNVCDVEKDEL